MQSAKDWEDIASLVPGRNLSQCKYRWSQSQEKQNKKSLWTEEEDQLLTTIMQQEEGRAWIAVAEQFNGLSSTKRTSRQCRERWRNHLDPAIRK